MDIPRQPGAFKVNNVNFNQVQSGEPEVMAALETLEEMKTLFEKRMIDNLRFVGIRASNYLPINGTLQRDKERMRGL